MYCKTSYTFPLSRIIFYRSLQNATRNFNARDSQDVSHVSGSDPEENQEAENPVFYGRRWLGATNFGITVTVYHGKSGRFSARDSTRQLVANSAKLSSKARNRIFTTTVSSSFFNSFYPLLSIKNGSWSYSSLLSRCRK